MPTLKDYSQTTTPAASAYLNAFLPPYNQRLMKKLLWMAGQLGGFNDSVSITNWANSMALIKNLLMTSPTDSTIYHAPYLESTVSLNRTNPSCISNYFPAQPTMSINSGVSLNLIPSPPSTSSCKGDLEQIPTPTTVDNKKPLQI